MKQIKAMLSGTADGAMLTDASRKIVLWNHAAQRLLGLSAEEVLGRLCSDVMRGKTLDGRPICSPECPIAARVTRGQPVPNFDLHTCTESGCKICLNVSSLPVPTAEPGRFTVVHLFRSISKREKVRKLEEELHAALREMTATAPYVKLDPPGNCNRDEPPSEIAPDLPLTRREREILCLLHLGKDTADIARELFISPTTVRNHIQHLLDKLGAHSRIQALAVAFPPDQGEASND